MRIALFFKDYHIGDLTFDGKKYIFSPIVNEIAKARSVYHNLMYFLLSDKQTEYANVPAHYDEFISATTRSDIVKIAKIAPSDNLFEKLYKVAGLGMKSTDFYILQA